MSGGVDEPQFDLGSQDQDPRGFLKMDMDSDCNGNDNDKVENGQGFKKDDPDDLIFSQMDEGEGVGGNVSISPRVLKEDSDCNGNGNGEMDHDFKTDNPDDIIVSKVDEGISENAPLTELKHGARAPEGQGQGQGLTKRRRSLSSNPPKSARAAFFENWETDDEISKIGERFRQVKRRFPGPAGLLPVLSPEEVLLLNNSEHPLSQHISKLISSELYRKDEESKDVMTQKSSTSALNLGMMSSQDNEILRMSRAPWRELLRVLQLDPMDPEGLVKLMNIRWLRKKVSKHPVSTKIPFLALVVQEEPEIVKKKRTKLSEKRKNPSIKLMDESGTVVAAIDSSIVNLFGRDLVPGTGIAIHNAGFLRFKRQLILTITRKNLVCITAPKRESKAASAETVASTTPNTTKTAPLNLTNNSVNFPPPEVIETPFGVRVLKFAEFSEEKAREEYDKICAAHIDITILRQKEDEDENEDELIEPSYINYNYNPSLFQTVRRPSSSGNVSRAPLPPFRNVVTVTAPSQRPQPQGQGHPARPLVSLPPTPIQSQAASDLSSVFGDDDDDELMQALDAVDFLFDENI